MVQITFIQSDQRSLAVEAEVGQSLMLTAVVNDVSGIIGECGGCCVCATCHVTFSQDDFARLGPIDGSEDAVLDSLPDRTPTSRLACQIEVSDGLGDLTVLVAG